ncbi:MAG: hypothetical protein ACLPWG_11940, partial [Steroidobacteraceae bacterium]
MSEQPPTASETAPAATTNAKLAHRGSLNKLKVSRGNMREMIPIFRARAFTIIALCGPWALYAAGADVPPGAPVTAQPSPEARQTTG